MPAQRDPITGRFLPAQPPALIVEPVEPVVAPEPVVARRRIRAVHVAAVLAALVLLAAIGLLVVGR